MKIFSSLLNPFFIFIAIIQCVYASDNMSWDSGSDQQIKTYLDADTFQNISLLYSYEHKNWELRIIFNPQHEQIKLNDNQPSLFQFYYGIFSRDIIPKNLENHLQDIVENQLQSSSGGYWGIASTINGKQAIDYFADATAIHGTGRSQIETQNEVAKEPIQIKEEQTPLDQEIRDLFKAQIFSQLSLNYRWEEQLYAVHFVHNPKREALFCSELTKPVRWPFAMTIEASSYPLALAKHLKSLIPDDLLKDADSVIDIADWVSYYRKNSVSLYKALHPILILNQLENPDIDAEIQTLFTSNQLASKSLYYELNGDFYGVLLIHNPEKLNLTSTLSFDTWEHGRLYSTANWNSKIGVFVDKEAPQELIDHISHLYTLSWWDSYWNVSIHNGDKMSSTYSKGSWRYTYTPYSWYAFMLSAKP